jgi:O-succinylbenzoic acid--CoA ligase
MPGSLHSTPLVAIVLPRPAAAAAVVGAWEAGEAVLPLDPRAPAAELRRLLDAARPTHLVDAGGRHRRPGGRPVEAGVAAVVATSGTAGTPKLVELTGVGIRASALAASAAVGAGPGDRWLACVPVHGVAGLAIVARGWHTGVPVEVHDRFDPDQVARAAAPGGATLVSLVPTMLWRLLERGRDLRGFRRVLLGGAAAPPGLVERAARAGVALTRTYGLTETFGGVAHDGHALAGVQLSVAADGEIGVRGEMVLRRYRGDPGATAAALRGGVLHTGDLGRLEPGGRLVVLGRRDDMICTGGVNVHPLEVEQALSAHPAVADAAVGGLPDPEWGERVTAFVVPADPARPPTLAELRRFVVDHLAAAKAPRQLVLVEQVPRTPSGKVLRRQLASVWPAPARLPRRTSRRQPAARRSTRRRDMGVDDFRERAGDGVDDVEQQIDERTGDRFDQQTDQAADQVQERIGGSAAGQDAGEYAGSGDDTSSAGDRGLEERTGQ